MPEVADIGLESQEDLDHLVWTLGRIDLIIALHDEIVACDNWGEPGSALDRLGAAMPEHPVPLDYTLPAAWSATRVSLQHIQHELRGALEECRAIFPTVLQSIARRALLASGRVCYILAPEDHGQRVENALDILILDQDARSQRRHYEAMETIKVLDLAPSQDLVERQETKRQSLVDRKRRVGDEAMLRETARLIGEQLRARGAEEHHAQELAEHFSWLFHVYSGVSHAWGWPWMVRRTESAPGHFIADLSTTVSIGHIALTLARDSTISSA